MKQAGRFFQLLALCLVLTSCIVLISCKQAPQTEDSGGFNNLEAEKHLLEAQKLIRKGDFEAAFMHLNKALSIRPNDPAIHRDMGWLYVYTDQIDKAAEELKQLEAMSAGSPEADYLSGAIYDRLEQPRDAVQHYRLALSGSKGQPGLKSKPELYFDLAASLNDINQHQEALQRLEEGLRLSKKAPARRSNAAYFNASEQVNFYFALCSTHYSLKNLDQALKTCEKAADLTTDPKERETITDFMHKLELLQVVDKI
ncbi:MAG: tetratricopeptide repeat protein [Vampirovibrionales bacterium]|nr:tetratricopeptide repeat protein [Vampirovibrionales bacterium]